MDSAKELSGTLRQKLINTKKSVEEIDYCQECRYPKDECACENLKISRERSRRDEWLREEAMWARCLGGWRAYRSFTLESFETNEKNKDAVKIAKAFDPNKQNLFIFGPAGVGKTHLAVALVRGFKSPRLYKMFNILRSLRGADDATGEQGIIDSLTEKQIIILDDLGAEKGTEYAWTVLYEIIDGRYMNLINGLVVTSNLSLDKLAEKLGDDRIPSRLAEMCTIINLTNEKDYRNEKAKQNKSST